MPSFASHVISIAWKKTSSKALFFLLYVFVGRVGFEKTACCVNILTKKAKMQS